MKTPQRARTETAIWARLLGYAGKALTVAGARAILLLAFLPEDRERMHELAAKARDGSLTPAEQDEIAAYERVGNVLGIMHAKARHRLKSVSSSNKSGRQARQSG